MTQELDGHTLAGILQAEDVEELTVQELMMLVREEIGGFLPDGVYRVDPRNGDRILYHSSRGHRPHDNIPEPETEILERACAICQGDTTGVIDVAELSEGFTFINKNLFPILYPSEGEDVASGLHLLQWTSSQHDKDWHNMPLRDCVVVMVRLAALEKMLLEGAPELPKVANFADGPGSEGVPRGFVIIIKNYGRLVGGSLIHGHQQIAFTNVMPRHFHDNWRFTRDHGETFSAHMLRETPTELLVKDYGPAILVVPSFMRRPYDMMLLLKDVSRQYLHELDERELEAVAESWQDGIRAMRAVMPRMGREIAYNVIVSNGPGAGLYVEFLPYTQETGGMEHLGLAVCQELPERAAACLREILSESPARAAPGKGRPQ
jgi:galactose-1-phosphate uridylyltransferase